MELDRSHQAKCKRCKKGCSPFLNLLALMGVKGDVIHLLEMLCEEFGGRVELAKAYYKALTASGVIWFIVLTKAYGWGTSYKMFQSAHPCAQFHAASRAISGGPIYVSDSVGKHNFQLLKSLVLPDGSILRCQHYALPSRDCLFEDPLRDGKTMLKI
ncbi:hypothetical protein ACH5RR_025495 [Cinchona calisaya]|uniref:Uncharacterized protein n=1 Tax=Cinchona calisaya TaxID=153742 RepID=A0ABD2Z4T4_9GENT